MHMDGMHAWYGSTEHCYVAHVLCRTEYVIVHVQRNSALYSHTMHAYHPYAYCSVLASADTL
jgi:hypothetical protein